METNIIIFIIAFQIILDFNLLKLFHSITDRFIIKHFMVCFRLLHSFRFIIQFSAAALALKYFPCLLIR